jgi:type IV pilus assembly protein PilY1
MKSFVQHPVVTMITQVAAVLTLVLPAYAAVMDDYSNVPPFVSQSVPPLVLLEVGKDHKLYYNAYNDGSDLDEDGRLDIDYKHSIDYYGYFDPVKCYSYDSTNKRFNPAGFSAKQDNAYSLRKYGHTYTKFCDSTQWSGNILNWLTMTRMDVLRKVLYGGRRSTDDAGSTILERIYLPKDAHSFAKELTGRLCRTTTPDATTPEYTYSCVTANDCDSVAGYSDCVDKSNNLVGFDQAPQPTACTANVTVTKTDGKILVVRYNRTTSMADAVECGSNSSNLLDSYDYLHLTSTTPYTLVSSFADSILAPTQDRQDHYNILATAEFNVSTVGNWQFMVDGDDGADLYIYTPGNVGTLVASSYDCHPACFTGDQNSSYRSLPYSPNDPLRNYDTICDSSPNIIPMTYNIPSNGWYRLVVHQTERAGLEGVRVWYKKPGDTIWRIFGAGDGTAATGYADFKAGPSPAATIRAYAITSANECSVMAQTFVETGVPVLTTVSAQRHLFCSTTNSVAGNASGDTSDSAFVPGPPVLELVKKSTLRLWDWGATERPVCSWRIFGGADTDTSAPTSNANASQYVVRVKVCDPGSIDSLTNFEKCKEYTTGGVTSRKPIGLLQKYGEGTPGDKVCSRTFYKSCSVDTDCTTATEGLCIPRSPMYFGLLTTSYGKNLSGGVLRKDISSISDEIKADGTFDLTVKSQGNIIRAFDRFRIVGYNYGSWSYDSTPPFGGDCTAFARMDDQEGKCRDWGNPIAEMMYEGLRYFAGKGVAETNYDALDSWISSKQEWGIPKSGTTTPRLQPFGTTDGATADSIDPTSLRRDNAIFPRCSKPFAMVISDINPSFDSDKLPGSAFNTFTEDTNKPLLNINVSTLADTIGTAEGIKDQSKFIGQSSLANNDDLCTAKTASGNLSLLRGLCPEEPTRRGSYYAASVAYYGKTYIPYQVGSGMTIKTGGDGKQLKSGLPVVTTYAVPVASPIPDMKIRLSGNKNITMVPFAKAVYYGSGSFTTSCWGKCTKTIDDDGLRLSNCASDAYCGGEQIVPLYVNDIRYDASGNLVYGDYRINFEDSEQGNDHDMDAVIKYEICTQASVTAGYGTGCKVCSKTDSSSYPRYCESDADCNPSATLGTCRPKTLASDQIMVTLDSVSAAAGIDTAAGFIITGTSGTRTNGQSNDGPYLPVRNRMDRGNPGTPLVSGADTGGRGLPPAGPAGGIPVEHSPRWWSKVFTASGASSALLNDPLWYAAKWGAFTDANGNGKPDLLGEWDKDGNGVPDNYYLVVNPLKLEQQLDKALTDILSKISSGTAASILSNSEGTGANLLQAVFYPQKTFDNNTGAVWIGELLNLWYYLDPLIDASTIREDTDYSGSGAHSLNLKSDYVANLYFDTTTNQTSVKLYQDLDGNGTGDLFKGTVSPDVLKSIWRAGRLLWDRDLSSSPRSLYTSLNGSSRTNFVAANATTLRPYLQAADDTEATSLINYSLGYDSSGYRSRTVTIGNKSSVWKLGDIVSSTPRIISSLPANSYHLAAPLGYSDQSYASFLSSNQYKQRGMAFVGANDGMLHAFKLGALDVTATGYQKATLSGTDLGTEQWAFIPKNALPYLKYLTDTTYNHLYFVDATSTVADVSITVVDSGGDGCADATYWNCIKKSNVIDANKDLVSSANNWKTVLIGGMGLGGATRILGTSCTDCIKTPLTLPGDSSQGFGYSSYFALDISDQASPSMMWEFTHPALGYATSGPAIIRAGDSTKNGRWFAVFASGPTGPIETTTHQFQGRSDQSLKIFVLDLKSGALVRTIDKLKDGTSLSYAFAGSMAGGAIDTDRWNPSSTGNYKDDAVYVGYVSRTGDGTTSLPYTWTNGGVVRLNTYDSIDPAQWTLTKIVDGVGPVTTAIARLQDRKNKNLWLYFGTGRYFFKSATAGIDDNSSQRALFGIKEPCYGTANDLNAGINSCEDTPLTLSNLTNQTTGAVDALQLTKDKGWYINLDAATATSGAERVVTNTVALTNGSVFFTTFKPTADICGFAGTSFLWATKYNTGYQAPGAALLGKALIQLSTGAFEEVALGDPAKQNNATFTDREKRRQGNGMQGKPPADAPLLISRSGNKPVKKILNLQVK